MTSDQLETEMEDNHFFAEGIYAPCKGASNPEEHRGDMLGWAGVGVTQHVGAKSAGSDHLKCGILVGARQA